MSRRWAKAKQFVQDNQPTIFDQTEQAKQQGMEASYQHADSLWKREAAATLQLLIKQQRFITSEDIITILEERGITTGTNKAIGAIMQAAKRSGQIQATDQWRESKLKRRHKAPVRVWEAIR